jgi:hypothetical protein
MPYDPLIFEALYTIFNFNVTGNTHIILFGLTTKLLSKGEHESKCKHIVFTYMLIICNFQNLP